MRQCRMPNQIRRFAKPLMLHGSTNSSFHARCGFQDSTDSLLWSGIARNTHQADSESNRPRGIHGSIVCSLGDPIHWTSGSQFHSVKLTKTPQGSIDSKDFHAGLMGQPVTAFGDPIHWTSRYPRSIRIRCAGRFSSFGFSDLPLPTLRASVAHDPLLRKPS